MSDLVSRTCTPCRGGVPPLAADVVERLLQEIGAGWQVVDGHHLEKEYRFRNFRDALAFAVRVGEIAETERHHPDIFITWGAVRLTIWTHAIDGLTENDFILAAKVDRDRVVSRGQT